jgi:signal transduction histidine kinase
MSEYTEGSAGTSRPRPAASGQGELELRLRRAEALARIPGQVRYDLPLEDVLSDLAARIVEETEAVAASLVLLNDADLSRVGVGACNLPEGYVEGMLQARAAHPEAAETFRQAVSVGQSWIFRDAPSYLRAQPEYQHMLDVIDRVPYRTLVATPFRTRPETIGVVYLYYSDAVDVDSDEVEFARAVAEQAAPVMDNAWLFNETQRRANEVEALSKADQSLHRSILLEDVYHAMIDLAVDLLGADRSLLLTWDDRDRLQVSAARGVPDEELAALGEVYHAISRSMYDGRRPEITVVEDLANDTRVNPAVRRLASAASSVDIPVYAGGEYFASFVLGYDNRRTFTTEDRRLFDTLAARAGLAIQNALLFNKTERRANEVEALYRADAALHRSLRLEDVCAAMIDLATGLLAADSSLVATFGDDDRLSVIAHRGITPGLLDILQTGYRRFDRDHFRRLPRPVRTGFVEDIRTNPAVDERLRERASGSFAEVPVMVGPDVWGVFSIGWLQNRRFGEEDRRVFEAFSARVSLAIQNALLFEQSERRTSELEALYRADEALHRSLRLEDVERAMVDLAVELLGATSSLVVTWDETDRLAVRASTGIEPDELARIYARYQELTRERFALWQQPYRTALVEDVQGHPKLGFDPPLSSPASLAEIPVPVGDGLWGFFSIGWRNQRSFSEEDRRLFDAFASRASLAIQNALLFEQAQRSASMEERQRIARELHDSVSQSLYGIGLGARTALRRLGDAAPADVTEPMDYVVQLAESGLAETRALIFELVPESLEEQGLVLALQRQAAAVASRHRVEVAAYLADEPDISLRAKEALYRIAQESLQNMAKHAQATAASVSLRKDGPHVVLVIEDNGLGFDTGGEFPGHFGLRSMEERARRIGGDYAIRSTPGQGTAVTVTVPVSG